MLWLIVNPRNNRPLWRTGRFKNRLIRCVGNPHKRFSEDALRIMRGMRFASTLGFRIEEETLSAMLETKIYFKKLQRKELQANLEVCF